MVDDSFEYRGIDVVFDKQHRIFIDGVDHTNELHGKLYTRDRIRSYIEEEFDVESVPLSEYVENTDT